MCVFLFSKSIVDKLSNKSIQVRNHSLSIRPLMEKNKRVVISNVCPIISHEFLIDLLKSKGITPASQMSYLRAGLNKPGRSHIMSFRRQIYVTEDVHLIPESFQISYEDTTYWIYFSTDSTCCFICKQKGHIAKACPNYNEERATVNVPGTTSVDTVATNTNTPAPQFPPLQEDNQNKGIKRSSPASTSSENPSFNQSLEKDTLENSFPEDNILFSTPTNTSSEFRKPKAKKQKNQDNSSHSTRAFKEKAKFVEETLSTARQMIENSPSPLALNCNQFKSFLIKSWGQVKVLEIAQEFTKDIGGLTIMIDLVYPYLEDRSLKSRCSRIKKKLLSEGVSESEMDSDQSQESDLSCL